MKKLRFATLSSMGIANAHIRGIVENENTELVAICDVDPERIAQEKELYPAIRTYVDYRKVLACHDIDAVVVTALAAVESPKTGVPVRVNYDFR